MRSSPTTPAGPAAGATVGAHTPQAGDRRQPAVDGTGTPAHPAPPPRNRVVQLGRFGDPDGLEVVDAPLPTAGRGEVRVRVLASSLEYTDVVIRRHLYAQTMRRRPPFVLGYDVVGEIDQLGDGVRGFRLGDRVADLTVLGSNAAYRTLRADDLVRVPAGVDAAEAAAMILSWTTAYQLLHRAARVQRGQRVLVQGAAGAVGQALLVLGGMAGLERWGTARGEHGALVRELGATPIDYRREDFTRVLPGGFDVVFDGVGEDGYRRSLAALKRGGLVSAYGYSARVQGQGRMLALLAWMARVFLWRRVLSWLPGGKRVRLYSINLMRARHPGWFREDLARLFDLLATGAIRPRVAERIAFDDVVEAHRRVEAGGLDGKLVLCPDLPPRGDRGAPDPSTTTGRVRPGVTAGTSRDDRAGLSPLSRLVAVTAIAAAAPLQAQPAYPALHVNPSLEDCSVQFAPILTQAAFRRFVREFGSVSAFKQVAPASTLGRGRMLVSIEMMRFTVDEWSDAWNDTFAHPDDRHPLGATQTFPKLKLRVGVTDDLDVGAFYTRNVQANYGWIGLDGKYRLLTEGETMPVSLAVRAAYTKTLYVGDMDMHALTANVSVDRRLWRVVRPYVGLGADGVFARETSDAVSLRREITVAPHLLGGLDVTVRERLSLGAEFTLGARPSAQVQIGGVVF